MAEKTHYPECGCEGCKPRDIVRVQKEAWARIAEEERTGKRRPPVIRWSAV
jgi:hypothetical protein